VAATREKILDAVAALLERGVDPTYAAVAGAAEVQERTVYRHFPTREDLHREFWARVHRDRIGVGPAAADLPALLDMVGAAFAGFSANEGLVRAMLHSAEGRAIRLAANEERRRRFEKVAAAELPGRSAGERRQAAAAAQVLASAMAWEYLQDYWGMGPAQSSETIQNALAALFRGWRQKKGEEP
jgi:AcrR family transcriptional regulator